MVSKIRLLRRYTIKKIDLVILFLLIFVISTYFILRSAERRKNIVKNEPVTAKKYMRTFRPLPSKARKLIKQHRSKQSYDEGCDILFHDPFDPEIMRIGDDTPHTCIGMDWVKCEESECFITKDILSTTDDVECIFRDILFKTDTSFALGNDVTVYRNQTYILHNSDFASVECTGTQLGYHQVSWAGQVVGFRRIVEIQEPPQHRPGSANVLILCLGSMSLNEFVRKMSNTYKYMATELNFTFFKGYNALGPHRTDAIFPMLTGKNKYELLNKWTLTDKLNVSSLLHQIFKLDGYRTAYFDDDTNSDIFSMMEAQPPHHSLKTFMQYHQKTSETCIGESEVYEVLFNLTFQFFKLSGKKLCVSYVSSVACSDECGVTSSADDAAARLLRRLALHRDIDQALLVLVGDHGSSNPKILETEQGRYEQRLPLLAIKLPNHLKYLEPTLKKNMNALTTPYDIHTTVLDAVGLVQEANDYIVGDSRFYRGMSLLDEISKERSCRDADIPRAWCSCPVWHKIDITDPNFMAAVTAFVDFINDFTEDVRNICESLSLTSIVYVKRQSNEFRTNQTAVKPKKVFDVLELSPRLEIELKENEITEREFYKVKIEMSPSGSYYEAILMYKDENFTFDFDQIHVENMHHPKPCINKTHYAYNLCHCKSKKYIQFN